MRPADKFYKAYFLFHALISLVIDSGIVLPKSVQCGWQRKLLDYHVQSNDDFLVREKPVWLQGFVWIELFFQVPFFIWAARNLPSERVWPVALVYAVEASTTTFACLAEIIGARGGINYGLVGVYLPTLLIPLYMAYDFTKRLSRYKEKML